MCYDGDASKVWREERRRARKAYDCDECGAPIPRGRDYCYITSLYDGSWTDWRVHVECMALWRFVQWEVCGGEGLIMIGGLHEELLGYVEPDLDDEGEVVPGAVTLMDIFNAIRDGYAAQASEARP